MSLTKKFFCPVNGWDCPYCKKDLSCALVDEECDPVMECDDAAIFWEPGEDYFVWEDGNGDRHDAAELLKAGYHFINGEPVKPDLDPELVKVVQEIFASPPMGMKTIEIRNPNWEG